MRIRSLAAAGVVALALACFAALPAGASAVSLDQVGAYDEPVFVTSDPANPDRLFVVERKGDIELTTPAGTSRFLDIGSLVQTGFNEQGLLSMAFAPDYSTSGLFYVFYVQAGTGALRVSELRASGDSADPATHRRLGRATRSGETLPGQHYIDLADAARAAGVVVKVNTVVTTVNARESIWGFILLLNPQRWKILQAAPVAGQNDEYIGALTPPRADFDTYVQRHQQELACSGIRVVVEPIEQIRGSYIMVDPRGRFFDSTAGTHSYSRPILEVGLDSAFAEVDFDPAMFLSRGGDADWRIRQAPNSPTPEASPVLAGVQD